jgi:hypothetical protein
MELGMKEAAEQPEETAAALRRLDISEGRAGEMEVDV